MKTIHIRAIGRLPEPWQREAESMYSARLKSFTKLEIVELPEGQKGSAKPDAEHTKIAESASLLRGVRDNAFVVALDETGTEMNSASFSQKLSEWSDRYPVIFIIGGSWGLHQDAKKRANASLSFGKITLPHGLVRIVLLEQLYRACMIENGRAYHK
ncbi:23S rRNA (pseudouridine(1915)-N(3))-methyltransferase RlmH [Patescibacteria group bacterium]|uniref:Ribosomal RNA large subunit methyltransferase H n=1 Tax=candidate division WWE3 bacterium TaxID=2053526 RepID=A0A928Y6J5_UNCKA|nr:23S rRNA (pseudouridine(1915)-N(3))-methyltransferase RlmH [candidate division WWE3 bacterium]MCL4732820.1 23S rRNA (pseudouridine(1915)-N(3))-methyltransferase RlmH [Patescibacteria group bacterium]